MQSEGDGATNAADQWFELSKEALSRLERNDPGVTRLSICGNNWIDGAHRAIANSTCLKNLSIWLERGDEGFWYPLFSSLATNRSIEKFSLFEDGPSFFEDDSISDLAPFFKNNNNLRSIEFGSLVQHKPFGIDIIIKALSSCKSDQLEHIKIYGIFCTDEESAEFIDLVGKQQRLRTLDLGDLFNQQRDVLSIVAHVALTNLLESPASTIQDLRIQPTGGVLNRLADVLLSEETLTSLDLSHGFLCAEEMIEFFDALPSCSLVKLSMSGSYFNDECITLIGNALADNDVLEYLDLSDNYEITAAGWREFSKCLRNPYSALVELDLRQCSIDDERAAVIVSALASNSCLKILHLKCFRTTETKDSAWEVLSHLLCDTSSIDSIAFSSNHTIHTIDICSGEEGAPEDVISLLEMNKNESNAGSARRKILKYKFSEEKSSMHVFARMPEAVLPCAIGWVGRDRHGYSAMYNLLRCLPSIVCGSSSDGHNAAVGTKKRKVHTSTTETNTNNCKK